METFDLYGVEIFETGDYGTKGRYAESDLDAMVAASKRLNFNPPLKSGHVADKDHASGQPAMGWTANMRRVGSKLLADFIAMPKAVADAVKARAYDRVSAEIFRNVDFKGEKYPAVIKAVGLLGAEMPQIPTLKPLHEMQFDAATWGEPVTVEFTVKGETTMTETEKLQAKIAELEAEKAKTENTVKTFSAKLDEFSTDREATKAALKSAEEKLAKFAADRKEADIKAKVESVTVPAFRPFVAAFMALSDETKVIKFAADGKTEADAKPSEVVDAFIKLLNDKSVKSLFTTQSKAGDTEPISSENPGIELHAKTEKFMADNKVTDYGMAQKAVLKADPDLKRRYAGIQN